MNEFNQCYDMANGLEYNENQKNKIDIMGFGKGSIGIYITLCVLGILLNISFLVFSFYKKLQKIKKQKKISSLEKLMMVLSAVEICISVIWFSNSIAFQSPIVIKKKCEGCLVLGGFTIFFYILDWIVISMAINQFKKIILNPLDAMPNKKIIQYLVCAFVIAIVVSIIAYFTEIVGLSVIFLYYIIILAYADLFFESKLCKKEE